MEDLIIPSYSIEDAERDFSAAHWLNLDRTPAMPVELFEHLLDRLRKGVAIFVFTTKKDGSYRKAIGTLNEAVIPTVKMEEGVAKVKKLSADTQTFYDLQIQQFRSFNVDSVVAIIDFL